MKWEDLVKMMSSAKCKQCKKERTCRKQCDVGYNGCEDYEPTVDGKEK